MNFEDYFVNLWVSALFLPLGLFCFEVLGIEHRAFH